MKKLVPIAIFFSSLLCNMSHAAESFSGFYISGGIGQKNGNVNESLTNGGTTVSLQFGDNSLAGQISGGYSFAMDGGLRLGIGAFYDLGKGRREG